MFLYFSFKPVTLEVKFSSGVENLISCCFSFRFFTATQFEPLRARRAFPCFDEPAMKATFNVTLVHDPNLIALSNMPIYRSQIDDGWKYDHFRKTVKMSTYLAAFAVGDFKYKETKTGSGIQVHILVELFSNGRGGDHLADVPSYPGPSGGHWILLLHGQDSASLRLMYEWEASNC